MVFTEKPSFSFDIKESHPYFVNNFLNGILPKFFDESYFNLELIFDAYEIKLGSRMGVMDFKLKKLLTA